MALVDLAKKGMLADPGQHFIGKYEVEFKLRVDGLERTRDRLERLKAVPFAIGNKETDLFFDLDDDRLTRNGQTHVLRRMLPSDRVLWIVKGPAKDECIAMDLPEFDKAVAMLRSLGFKEQLKIAKSRDIYFLQHSHVTLDAIDGLGTFVELAAMTDDEAELPDLRARLVDDLERLGLCEAVQVTTSYRQMLEHNSQV